MRRSMLLAALLLTASCGAEGRVDPEPPPVPESPEMSAAPEGTCRGRSEAPFAAHVPLAAVTEEPMVLSILNAEDEMADAAPMRLAMGPGFPCAMTRTVNLRAAKCPGEELADITLSGASVDQPGLVVRASDRTVEIEALEAGHYRVELTGAISNVRDTACSTGGAPDRPLAAAFDVTVVEPMQVRLLQPLRCLDEDPAMVEEGSRLEGFRIVALDEEARITYFNNSESAASMPARLTSDDVAIQVAGPGFEDVRLEGRGTVRVESFTGRAFNIRSYTTDELDGVHVEFYLPGVAGSWRTLESGETYDGFGRQLDHIVVAVVGRSVGGVGSCSPHEPPATGYVLESLTPEVCAVVDPLPFAPTDYVLPGDRFLSMGARVLKDGLCHLELTVEGSTQRFEATLLRTAGLLRHGG